MNSFKFQQISLILTIILLAGIRESLEINIQDELRITLNQKAALDKLRQRVSNQLTEEGQKDDLQLVRWLRATKFNVDEAQKRLTENVRWRKQNKIAGLVNEDFSDIQDEFPYIFTVDKQGQPCFIGFAGEWDVRNAVLTGRATRVIRYIVKAMESASRMVRKIQLAGGNITRLNLIIDLAGFNLQQHSCVGCLFRILDFLTIYDKNYPGFADRIIFTNTPATVAAASELVRSNANSETLKAIKIYGRDRTVWRKALLDFIDIDQLPIELGGRKNRNDMPRELELN